MRKVLLFILVVLVAMTLIAAAPVGTGGAGPQCFDPVHHKYVPCVNNNRQVIKVSRGDPSMEKISYFYYLTSSNKYVHNSNFRFIGVYSYGCFHTYLYVGTYKLPVGCNYRYQY